MTRYYVVSADRITDGQRERLTELVKSNSKHGWWHHFLDTWIVSGLTVQKWYELLREPITTSGPDSLLILRLPDQDAERFWRLIATEDKRAWFKRNYSPLKARLRKIDP